jgi:hypothetical protein
MTTWIVAGVLIALALIYGLVFQPVLFWTVLLALVVMGGVIAGMYCLNREAEKANQTVTDRR